jgi:hypothetical protein
MDGSSSTVASPTLSLSSLPPLDSGSDAAVRTNADGTELNKVEDSPNSPMPTRVGDPPSKDFLDRLNEGEKHAIRVVDLMESATTSLDHIQTLYNTNHPQLKHFKKDINRAVGDYVEAVESSTETAQHSVTFSTNICHLLETLRDPQLCDSDRNQFIEEVKQIGARALESAQQTYSAFDYVQRSLYEISQKMEQQVNRKEAELRQLPAVHALQDVAGRVREVFESAQQFVIWWANMKSVFHTCKDAYIQPMSRPRIDLLEKNWKEVGECAKAYNRTIALLKPQFPRPPKVPSLWSRLKSWKK